MQTKTANWNDRIYYSTECACGYRSNWTPSEQDNDRKAAAHAKKCATRDNGPTMNDAAEDVRDAYAASTFNPVGDVEGSSFTIVKDGQTYRVTLTVEAAS